MSRRKQARPIRVLESEDGADMELTNGGAAADDAESASGSSLADSEDEDAKKTKRPENSQTQNESPSERMFEFDENGGGGASSPVSQRLQDDDHEMTIQNADDEEEEDDDDEEEDEVVAKRVVVEEDRTRMAMAAVELLKTNALQTSKPSTLVNDDNNNTNNTESCNGYENVTDTRLASSLDAAFQTPPPFDLATSHITLKALENTKVAVAQFAAKALVNGGDNPEALQEWAALQSNLMQLHQQYMLQMSMIQQLSQQLQVTNAMSTRSSSPGGYTPDTDTGANGTSSGGVGPVPLPLVVTRPVSTSPQILTPPKPSRTPTPIKQELRMISPPLPVTQALPSSKDLSSPAPTASTVAATVMTTSAPPVPPPPPPPPPLTTSSIMPSCSVSSSFASTIITNLDPPPSPSEPNTLEMLQKRAQGILENASQGYANNLADELAFRKGGGPNGKGSLSPYDSKNGGRNEPFFKHRCRFCGKVFGSDSALQIHIRSHTGERPFKCNVCGSRFTTKGNLKVHFQRHISKFPDIKMNPNPVPEHLDKMHPPLLAQMQAGNSNQSMANTPTVPSASIPGVSQPSPFRTAGGVFPGSLSHLYRPAVPGQELFRPSHESLMGMKPLMTYPYFGTTGVPPPMVIEQEQPENLCNKPSTSSQHSYSPPMSENGDVMKRELMDDEEDMRGGMSESSELAHDYQPEEGKMHHHRHHDSESEGTEGDRCSPYGECSVDSKYSNDEQQSPREREENAQEQPENLSNKMRGNTTCSICFKTFACNSALEIHYRSHTKERPFKCTVCDRGFSTKGNMKQHMLTHKMRDMPSNLFEKTSPGGSGSVSVPSSLVDETSNTSSESKEPASSSSSLPLTATAATSLSTGVSGLRCVSLESLSAAAAAAAATVATSSSSSSSLHKLNALGSTKVTTIPVPEPPPPPPPPPPSILPPQKRSPSHDTQLQVPPKRQASLPKHLCNVCTKNFSSSSALQIHMRTHTGDKPFKCNICFKAFTTKGNLKVHMGTHMWTNGASRRGRRMSLEMPALQLSNQDPQPDFFHRRTTDFLYPYFPGAIFNGNVGQKLDENLRNGFFPFGAYNRHINSDSHSVSVPWDLHFEKRAAVEREETPSPPRQQPQGESLAA